MPCYVRPKPWIYIFLTSGKVFWLQIRHYQAPSLIVFLKKPPRNPRKEDVWSQEEENELGSVWLSVINVAFEESRPWVLAWVPSHTGIETSLLLFIPNIVKSGVFGSPVVGWLYHCAEKSKRGRLKLPHGEGELEAESPAFWAVP